MRNYRHALGVAADATLIVDSGRRQTAAALTAAGQARRWWPAVLPPGN